MPCAAPAALVAISSLAIGGNGTTPKGDLAALARTVPAVGVVGGMGTGTLIGERWVVTAAHVADFMRLRRVETITFEIDGDTYEVEHVEIHPEWKPLETQMEAVRNGGILSAGDLALLRLSTPVESIEPMPLGGLADGDLESEVMLVGAGAFTEDAESGVEPRAAMTMPRGDLLAGTNRVDSIDTDRGELVITFSSPEDGTATEHEVTAFVGDSGGPIVAKRDGAWTLVGVIASIETHDEAMGNYGDETRATSISATRDWIESFLNDD